MLDLFCRLLRLLQPPPITQDEPASDRPTCDLCGRTERPGRPAVQCIQCDLWCCGGECYTLHTRDQQASRPARTATRRPKARRERVAVRRVATPAEATETPIYAALVEQTGEVPMLAHRGGQ